MTFEEKGKLFQSETPYIELITLHVHPKNRNKRALSETVQKFPTSPIRPAGSRFYSASCQCGRVFE